MIRVIIVDDHNLVRMGIKSILERFPDLLVVASLDNGRSALQAAKELMPDVILMDMSMPEMNGMDATQRIATDHPKIGVVILSMHKDKRFVSQAFRAGAKGYMLKDCEPEALVKAIRTVAAGERYICPEIVEVVIDDYIKRVPDSLAQLEIALTPREREVLQLIAEGNNVKNIAFLLKINSKTVDTHRQQVMKKLKLYSIAELTKYAIREGVTCVDS